VTLRSTTMAEQAINALADKYQARLR